MKQQFKIEVDHVKNENLGHPSFNVCPTRYAPVLLKHQDVLELDYMSWGLVPFWTKSRKELNQYKSFNARKESVIEGNRLWSNVRKRHRCVVPVQGYYEWQHKPMKSSKKVDKIPYYVKRKDSKLMFLAGMFDSVEFSEGDESDKMDSYTIITGPAPRNMKWLHERMPIVLIPGTKEWDNWLNDEIVEWNDDLKKSLKVYDGEDLEWYEVSRDVGKVTNDGEKLIKPVKSGKIQSFFSKGAKREEEYADTGDERPSKKVKREDDDAGAGKKVKREGNDAGAGKKIKREE